MGFQYVNNLPTPDEIKERFPLPAELKERKAKRDQEVSDVLTGKSDKFLVIIGPCSADNEDSVCDYAERLIKVQEKTGDRLIIIPRVYTNKPRTTGEGYKGMLHQPDPRRNRICTRDSSPSARCTCAYLPRQASPPPMKCSIRRT